MHVKRKMWAQMQQIGVGLWWLCGFVAAGVGGGEVRGLGFGCRSADNVLIRIMVCHSEWML